MYSLILKSYIFIPFFSKLFSSQIAFLCLEPCMPSPLCFSFLLVLFSCFLNCCTCLAVMTPMPFLPFWCSWQSPPSSFSFPSLTSVAGWLHSLDFNFVQVAYKSVFPVLNNFLHQHFHLVFLYFFSNLITKENIIWLELWWSYFSSPV